MIYYSIMPIYSLGSIMQEIHSLRYPIRSSNEFVNAFSVFGEVYVKGRRIDEIAEHIKYPVYSGGDCISKILNTVKGIGGKPVPEKRTYQRPTFKREEPRTVTQGIRRIGEDRDVKTAVEYGVRIEDIDRRVKALSAIKATAGIGGLKEKDEPMGAEREKVELELKTALAKLSMEREEEIRYRLELELKKKELEMEANEAERERNNRMEIELKKKQLELEANEAERERNNRMEIELKKKQLELDMRKKEMEIEARKTALEMDMERRIQIAVKEKEVEIEKKIEESANKKIEDMRKKMEDEFRRKEEFMRKKILLEEREKALRGR